LEVVIINLPALRWPSGTATQRVPATGFTFTTQGWPLPVDRSSRRPGRIRVDEVLDEDVVPERELVAHREDWLDRLLHQLRPGVEGAVDLCYLIGPIGTGKTMLSRLALWLLRERHNVETAYINCWQHTERRPILYQVVDVAVDASVDRQTTGTAALADHVTSPPEARQRYVVLDEADQLHDGRVLYDLHTAPDLSLVLIGNDKGALFRGIDDRLQSRLSTGVHVECPAYEISELTPSSA